MARKSKDTDAMTTDTVEDGLGKDPQPPTEPLENIPFPEEEPKDERLAAFAELSEIADGSPHGMIKMVKGAGGQHLLIHSENVVGIGECTQMPPNHDKIMLGFCDVTMASGGILRVQEDPIDMMKWWIRTLQSSN